MKTKSVLFFTVLFFVSFIPFNLLLFRLLPPLSHALSHELGCW